MAKKANRAAEEVKPREAARRRTMNRRRFLKLTGAGLAGASLLSVAGCGGGRGGNQDGVAEFTFAMGPDNTGTLSRLVDRFNRQNEGRLRADYREMPADTGQYFDQLRTEFQAGSSDITLIGGDVIWPAQLAASGYIEPLPGASAAWAGGTSTSTPTPTTPSRTPPTSS